ncbi:hypothetical protein Tco_0261361 [Tanacetum coccineum]
MAAPGGANQIARRVIDDLIEFSEETSLNALIAEMEALEDQGKLFDTLMDLRNDREATRTKLQGYGSILNILQGRNELLEKIIGCVVDSGGVPKLDPKIKNKEIEPDEEAPSGIMWLKGRVNKDRQFLDYKIRSVGDKLKETEDKIKEGTLKVDHGTDAMTVVLGKEKGGYARGVESRVTYKRYFDFPRSRQASDERITLLQSQLDNERRERQEKELEIQNMSNKMSKTEGMGIGSGGSPWCQEAMGGTIAQTKSKRVPTPSYDSPLLGGNTYGSDENRLEQHELMDNVPPTPHDSPLSGGHIPGSDEGRPNINELMAICIKLSNKVLALKTSKTAQDLVIKKLKKKVKRLEKKLRARILGMKLFKIGASIRKSLDKENVSKHGSNLKTRLMFEEGDFDGDDMVNEVIENVKGDTVNVVSAATTGVSAASTSVTTTGVSISTAEPRTPPTTTPTAFEDEDLTIAQKLIKMRNALLAARHQKEEREQFSIYEQARFLVETTTKKKRFTYNQLKNKSLEEIQKLYKREQKWINDFIPMDFEMVKDSGKKDDDSQKQEESSKKRPRAEHDEESVKKQKLKDDC